ncbi:MFS transporter [Sphingomonas gilva]|uniref:MFS transporter n=1 Tax=Sphingomonas gilva TaxID=2305907 RepID=A0A396RKM1_9SPHN|nr:MFS transporter [Sphingomonas gilva]RHW16837.1 MFS transporter [Sphingomonas gilva]
MAADDHPQAHPSSPFAFAIFRDVWLANLASRFGGLIQSVGASWLMISLAASPVLVSLVQTATTLPIMLLALVAGALADTFDRRRLMIVAQVFMLAVSIVLAACAYAGVMTPWLLLALTFLIGCGAALNGPAWQASVGEMVPRPVLPAAVALNSMGFNVARSTGPAVGGVIVATAGAAAAFAVNALSYLGLIFVLARWRPAVARPSLPREPLGAAMMAGLRYVAMSPNILSVMIRAAVFGVGAGAVPALMPLMARDLVAGGALTYGLLLGAFGVGAVGGAFFATPLRRRMSSEAIVRAALIAFAVASVIAAESRWLPLTMLALLIGGGGWVMALSTFNVTVQLSAPRWVVARALALYQMAAFGGMAVGSWFWGMVTERWGVPTALLLSAGVLALCAAIGLRHALPKAEALNLDPLDRWREPRLPVALEPRSGPIVVTVAFRIDEADIPAFQAAMVERRRIRLRDGARGWTLLRDLEDRSIWIERYHSPTWTEYVRHNQRRTHTDADIGATLRALHRGEGPPVVHRMIEREPGHVAHDDMIMAEPLTDPARQS